MENCALCHKPLHERVNDNEMLIAMGFTKAFTYECECPVYYFDELTFVRDNDIRISDLSETDMQILRVKFRQKKEWIDRNANKYKGDYKDQAKLDFYKAFKNEDSEARGINSVIWGILYGLKRS